MHQGALILGYHRVADVPRDPFSMCVAPAHFDEQLDVLRRYTTPVSLQDLIRHLEEGSLPPRTVALTFDDGYVDNLYQAKPILARYDMPATVFVTTGYVDRTFWWDELQGLLSSPERLPGRLSLPLGGRVFEWAIDDTQASRREGQEQLLWLLYEQLLHVTPEERRRAMDALNDWAGAGGEALAQGRALSNDEIIALASDGMVEIGSHSVSHPMLAALSPDEQASEIQQSRHHLATLTGRPITSFSYPNGSLTVETKRILNRSGYTCACASYNDVVWSKSDRLHLPRFWIPDWGRERFARWLARWVRG